ncbi:hypothetical protein [Gaiella sp.]|uniref:hypothetical protein n=1 Tax=Gaiella sp. TaxID=2663207 RepID=UPI002E322461|nr:hypothetical protein [Gaiella sp.]HEX5583127.1 hypothetical protein [Gaiella sp.]
MKARRASGRFLVLAAALAGVSLLWLSGAGSAASTAFPTNTKEPRILGTTRVGSMLTGTRGLWTGNPTSFRFQWVRCPDSGGKPDGSDCAAIGGATRQQYRLSDDDAGRRLRVRVTAVNADGQQTAASNATPAVKGPRVPANTKPPTISGTTTVGSTLDADRGNWTGQPSFRYRWLRCDSGGGSCADISGADGQTYKLTSADLGATLRVRISATANGETSRATSVPTAVVRASAPAPPKPNANGCPAGTGTIHIGELSQPARLLIQGQQLQPGVVTAGTDSLTARFRVTACDGRPVQGALVYATAVPFQQFRPREQRTGSDGWAALSMGRQRGFPANPGRQQLLVLMVRARKGSENVLGGISSRRLVSFPVDLRT